VHLLNGTSVSIGTTGNLVAQCVLNGANCADIGIGGGGGTGTPPSVSISGGNYSTAPDGSGFYNPNTTFSITPVTSNSPLVCWRRVIAGPASAVWTGAITSNFNSAVTGIHLDAQSTNYVFRLDCFNMDGGTTSNEVSVTTNNGPVIPPTTGCPDTGWVPTLDTLGFTRASIPSTWPQIFGGASFPTYSVQSTSILVPKNQVQGLVFFGTSRATYAAVQFTTPNTTSMTGGWDFQASQIPNTSFTTLGSYYITVSRCPGDFRYNISNPQDSTEYNVCKSIRPTFGGGDPNPGEQIQFNLTGVSGNGVTDSHCGLAPNTTYYLNYVNASPDGGYDVGEHDCPNNASTCGVQIKASHN